MRRFAFGMSTYFSKVIKAGQQQREFNFRLPVPNDPSRYRVDFPNENGERLLFELCLNNEGKWGIVTASLPPWIYEAEGELANAIEENTKAAVQKDK